MKKKKNNIYVSHEISGIKIWRKNDINKPNNLFNIIITLV